MIPTLNRETIADQNKIRKSRFNLKPTKRLRDNRCGKSKLLLMKEKERLNW